MDFTKFIITLMLFVTTAMANATLLPGHGLEHKYPAFTTFTGEVCDGNQVFDFKHRLPGGICKDTKNVSQASYRFK